MQMQLPQTTFALIIFFINKHKNKTLLFGLICIIAGIIPFIDNLLFKNIVNIIEKPSTTDLISLLMPWALAYAAWSQIINAHWRFYDYVSLSLMPQLKADVVKIIHEYILYHDQDFFSKNMSGYIANRISESSRSIEMILYLFFDKILTKLCIIIFAAIAMYMSNIIFIKILLIWLLLFVTITILSLPKTLHYSKIFSHQKALISGEIVDTISNVNSIRMFSNYIYEKFILQKSIDIIITAEQKLCWFLFKVRATQGCLCGILIFLMLYNLIELRSINMVTIGDFIIVINLSIVIIEHIWDLTHDIGELFEEIGNFGQTIPLIKPYSYPINKSDKLLQIKNCTIEFKNVNFKYPESNELFCNKNLIIKGGEKIGLVGTSGSGKSSFVNLICRMYQPSSGIIYIDNQDIASVNIKSLRDNISIIPQEPILFGRSIIDNIKYGNLQASDEMIFEAAKKAFIHNDILKLPLGYNTICTESGGGLSGGQKQRIIIARAILKNAPILILDEATSALDNITEALVKKSLNELMKNKTVLVIAHRLSTLLDMDRILVFDQGKIIEDGTHNDLLQNKKLYYQLWKTTQVN